MEPLGLIKSKGCIKRTLDGNIAVTSGGTRIGWDVRFGATIQYNVREWCG
jgi:hypothetical protein